MIAAALQAQALDGTDDNLSGLVLSVGPIMHLCAPVSIEKAVQPLVALWHCPICHHRPSSGRQRCCLGLLQQLNSYTDIRLYLRLRPSADPRDLAISQHWRDSPCRSGTSVVVSKSSFAPVVTRIF